MKLRSLFTVLFSVAVVAGTVITLDAFAANPKEDSRIEEASEKQDASGGNQDSFVCEAEGWRSYTGALSSAGMYRGGCSCS